MPCAAAAFVDHVKRTREALLRAFFFIAVLDVGNKRCDACAAARSLRVRAMNSFLCEYYLSRENLARDSYLVSMMDKARRRRV